MTLIRTLAVFMMSLGLGAGLGAAQAQTESGYPQKPVRMIIPFAPAGTPRPIVARLHEALVKVLGIQDAKERFASGGVVASASRTPEEFAAYVSAESERWGKVARESGATID